LNDKNKDGVKHKEIVEEKDKKGNIRKSYNKYPTTGY